MKHKRWPVHIWFLDNDLSESAKALTDKMLIKTIDGCMGALLSAVFYFIGIRSKKHYDYYFSKERISETMSMHFKSWPLKKKPSFAAYSWRESRWCRSCLENCKCCIDYFNILQDEYAWRFGNGNDNAAFSSWFAFDAPQIAVPSAGMSKIVFPWKVIDPKFRRIDIVEGYRLQFMSTFEDNDPFKAYGACRRPIPQFVLDHFNTTTAFES